MKKLLLSILALIFGVGITLAQQPVAPIEDSTV